MCVRLWGLATLGSETEKSYAVSELRPWVLGYSKMAKPKFWTGPKVYLASEEQRVLLFPSAATAVTGDSARAQVLLKETEELRQQAKLLGSDQEAEEMDGEEEPLLLGGEYGDGSESVPDPPLAPSNPDDGSSSSSGLQAVMLVPRQLQADMASMKRSQTKGFVTPQWFASQVFSAARGVSESLETVFISTLRTMLSGWALNTLTPWRSWISFRVCIRFRMNTSAS